MDSWLQPLRSDEATRPAGSSWLHQDLFVERSRDSDDPHVDEQPDGAWIHAWCHRDDLVRASSSDPDEIDIAEMSGSRLRDWLRTSGRSDVGVLLHPDGVDEQVVLRPQAQPIQRVALET